MALTRVTAGVLREVWQKTDAQGPGDVVVTTGIKLSAKQLNRVEGRLVLTSVANTPVFSGVASIVGGFLVITVTNAGAPGATATWTLELTLNHSLQQRSTNGGMTLLVLNGTLGAPPPPIPETLAQAYATGAVAADQTLVVKDANGGPVIVSGTDNVGLTAGPLFEVVAGEQAAQVVFSQYSTLFNMNVELVRSRGTIGAPADVQVADPLGGISWNGRVGLVRSAATIQAVVTSVAGPAISAALDVYTSFNDVPTQAVRFVTDAAGSRVVVYGNLCAGNITPGGGADKTVVLTNTATLPAVPQADQVYFAAIDFGGGGAGSNLAAIAVEAEEPAIGGAAFADYQSGIPIHYNGTDYYLLARNMNPA